MDCKGIPSYLWSMNQSGDESTLCVMPWMALGTVNDGRTRLCCHMSGPDIYLQDTARNPLKLSSHSTKEIRQADDASRIRAQMSKGHKPEACKKCWNEEVVGIESFRQIANRRWPVEFRALCTSPTNLLSLKYLDLRLGNLCNLSCKMCNPYSSRNLIENWPALESLGSMTGDGVSIDQAKLNALSCLDWIEAPRAWEHLDEAVREVDTIYFSGGEPLILKRHEQILRRLVEQGCARNISLKYSTNLTVLPAAILELWQQFKAIEINVSLDGVDQLNSYIRPPDKWALILKNFDLLKPTPYQVQVVTTVQIYNAFRLPEIQTFAECLGVKWSMNFLHQPRLFSVKSLPHQLKVRLRHRLGESERLKAVADFADSADWSLEYKDFLKVTQFYEGLTAAGAKLAELVPELTET